MFDKKKKLEYSTFDNFFENIWLKLIQYMKVKMTKAFY